MDGSAFLDFSLQFGGFMIVVGIALTFFRLVRGPSMPDRVVALDMMTVAIVAICGLAALFTDNEAFLDVALVLALVGFLATVALARFAERRQARRQAAEEAAAQVKEGAE
ncbi:MAG: monovalent cation/H+ antiporter complex subunit F [Pseudomonadota bacterium]